MYNKKLLKIGELAKEAQVPISTIRYYCQIGLLKPKATTPGGYRLFEKEECIKRIKMIREIIFSKPTLKDIKENLEVS